MQFNCLCSRGDSLWKKQVIGTGKASTSKLSPTVLNPTVSLLGVISCLQFYTRNQQHIVYESQQRS